LTVRDLGVARQPVRVVVSRRLDLPLLGHLARTAREVPVWLCHGHDADSDRRRAWEGLGARLIPCDAHGVQLDPDGVLSALGSAGLTRVFCEGGGALAASLLAADLVDDLMMFTAGVAIGAEGLPAIGALGIGRLDLAERYELIDAAPIGGDVMHSWSRRAA
jgi:diaminohydroxyphosphoribosylaminopyrimidine deaminase/5-amino-6-(5-phosphoribosylamino)uracil reductase